MNDQKRKNGVAVNDVSFSYLLLIRALVRKFSYRIPFSVTKSKSQNRNHEISVYFASSKFVITVIH